MVLSHAPIQFEEYDALLRMAQGAGPQDDMTIGRKTAGRRDGRVQDLRTHDHRTMTLGMTSTAGQFDENRTEVRWTSDEGSTKNATDDVAKRP